MSARQGAGIVTLATELQGRSGIALRAIQDALRLSDGSPPAQTYDREVKSPNQNRHSPTEQHALRRAPHERNLARLRTINTRVLALLSEGLDIVDSYVPPEWRCDGYHRECGKVIERERRLSGLCDACRKRKERYQATEVAMSHGGPL